MRATLLALACIITLGLPARADDAPQAVKTIGIVSALGDTLEKKKVGITVFGNAETTEDIAAWKIDEFVIAEFTAQLRDSYTVVPVVYTKSDFFPDTRGIIVDADIDTEAAVARLPRPAGTQTPDAYIVVTKTFFSDVIAKTNQHLFGLGLYHPTRGAYANSIYAAIEVNVVDGRSGKRMKDRYPSGFLDFGATPDYNRMTYDTVYNLWGDGFSMSADQHCEANDKMKLLLKRLVAQTLKDFKLTATPANHP